ncbi:MAG: BACON domain-containing carbohydrate-binding protein [Arcicella sp.]|nr:BACON domain-containing carbohydrate-binding protein [Arcicella sp.]
MLIKKYLLSFAFLCLANLLSAQDNPRYLAFSLVNLEHRNPQLDDINKAADLGMNAFIISIRRDVIVGKKVSATNPWEQYDNQIKVARQRGMKICFRIVFATWCNNKTVGEPLDNNVATCSGFPASERMLGLDAKGVGRVHQQSFGYNGCDIFDDCGQMMTTSLSSAKTIKDMQDFTLDVLQRYKPVIDAGDVIYASAVITPEQEFGFPFFTTKGLDGVVISLFDYSASMINGFREWVKVRYGNDFSRMKTVWGTYANTFSGFNNIEPPRPTGVFNWTVFLLGQAGNDWYAYRHSLLKNYSQAFLKTVKNFDNRLKVVNDYGSIIDQPTVQRGTFSFKDIGEGTDGVKMNSSPFQDHRFIMDVARTSFADKWVMMEVESFRDRTDLQEQHFIEAYTHGAKLVGAFAFDVLNNQAHREMLQRMTDRFIKGNQQVEKIETCGTTISSVYELLEDGGCAFKKSDPQSDCRAYRDWANLKKVNGDKPVKVVMDESFTTGKPFKLSQNDLSACSSILNFKETYSTDCQRVGVKPKAADNLKGMIETSTCDKITGWALNTNNLDEIQAVDIYVDSVKIGTTQANIGNRLDLVTTFNSNKANFRGFTFVLPDSAWYKSGQVKRIYARFANTSTLLEDSGDLKTLACEGTGSGICGQRFRLIVSPDSLTNVLTRAVDYKIAVSSNTRWNITKNVNWLTTSTDTGSFNNSFTLKITANPDTGTRRGRVTLTAGNLTKSIIIAQKGVGQPYLTVSPDSITTITFVGAEYRVVTGSNVRLRLSKNVNWITTDPVTDINNGSFGLRIEANPDTATRRGVLTVSGQGITKRFYIIQKGKGQSCVGCNGSIDTDKPFNDPNDIAGRIAPATYRGWVESVNCCSIKGWAFDSQNYDENLMVDIYLDKQLIGSTPANKGYRTDLAFNYQSDKLLYKSFCFPIPKSTLDSFKNGKDKQLYVRFGGTVTKLFTPEPRFLNCKPNTVCPEGFNCEEIAYQDYLEEVFPNPSNGKYTFKLYSLKNQTAEFKLVDTQGLLLKNIKYDVLAGLNNVELDAAGVKNGVILLSIQMENGNILFKRLIKIE